MNQKHQMKDLVIFLPGIMGSVLKRRDDTLWSMPATIKPALLGRTAQFNPLYLAEDDPERKVLPDGIYAAGLMVGLHGIHGLALGEGYQRIVENISQRFRVTRGTPEGAEPANFIPFPYDWRRDNRVAASCLKELIDRKLPQWQDYTANKRAGVILLAHSMGGLVARYYLEALGGWEYCRALFTFGTPHRGSLNAIDSLCNGHTLFLGDLTNLVRSFTSVYQLLPTYPVIRLPDTNQAIRVDETDQLPGISWARAAAGLAFHDEINQHVRQRDSAYSQRISPIVGTKRDTYQSALLTERGVVLSYNLPHDLAPEQDTAWIRSGDGTVPYLSAIPVELSAEYRETFYPESHAWLASNSRVLRDLCRLLARMQDDPEAFRGALSAPEAGLAPALTLKMQSLYQAGTPIRPEVRIVNQAEDPIGVSIRLAPDDGAGSLIYALERDGERWSADLTNVPLGSYRVEVSTHLSTALSPEPVHELVEVLAV